MNIAITGSTGLVGTKVTDYFRGRGHSVIRICRAPINIPSDDNCLVWDIQSNSIDCAKLEDQDVVIHLAGANIAAKRWSPSYKETILHSRVDGTRLLAQSLGKLQNPPKILLSASAVGYYGVQDSSLALDENSPVGNDFLAYVCDQW